MALSEIEKLERRYAENPQGLTFAPLAEVHRKNGDVARALELLRPGLTLHPDYIPASIVLGRCHLDLGDLPSAESAFNHVLSLDGENVIALKALADIAERQYRFEESERWLHTLLAVDRSNDEAREQLNRVEASRRQAQVASSSAPDAAGLVTDEAPAASDDTLAAGRMAGEAGASSEERSSAAAKSSQPEAPGDTMFAWVEGPGSAAAAEAAPLELEELDLAETEGRERPAGIEIDQEVTLEEPVQPLSGLVGRDDQEAGPDLHVSAEPVSSDNLTSGEVTSDHVTADGVTAEHVSSDRASSGDASSDDVSSDEWAVETAEDIVLESAGASEFQVANAAEELLSERPFGRSEPSLAERPPVEREETAAVPPPGREPAWLEPIGFDQSGQTAGDSAMSEPAARESVSAETAADQSTREPIEAAAPPGTVNEAAEEQPAGWAARAWSPPTADAPRQTEADLLVTESMAELLLQQGHAAEALTVYRHLETRTGSERFRAKIAELERGAVPPAAAAPAPAPAYSVEQTHGQSVHAFLRGVLGARPPAVAAAPAASERGPKDASSTGAPTRPAHDSLSLSSVFGEESTPTPPAVPAAGAGGAPGGVSYDEFFGTAGSAPARPSRSPDAKSDDLDQFHAWLQNLKR